MLAPLEFERDITELDSKLEGLRLFSGSQKGVDITREIERLEKKRHALLEQTYRNLTPYQKVLVARHPDRPHCQNYIDAMIEDFQPLCGDRCFGEDEAIIGGLGRLGGMPIVIMGHERGHDTESRLKHNFGMPKPEGYRKARRLMELANHFKLPLITLVDTPGAHPGLEAEERGQAEAIARSIATMCDLEVPAITLVTGEGGSGGAIALAVANTLFMLEHSVYSVISPEGCASILWRSADKKVEAAAAQKFTAQDLLKLGVIDQVIPEPLGGAHRHHKGVFDALRPLLIQAIQDLSKMDPKAIKAHRHHKFLSMGKLGL